MKIVEQYVFDNEDRRLLSIEIPDDPCNKCQINSGCLGCCDETEYCNFIKPYKDRNIYDLALKIKRMHKLQKDIINMQKEIDDIAKEIEDIGLFSWFSCIVLFLNWGDFMKKQIMYLGYIIKEEDGRIDIYKNKKYMSSIKSDWNNGVTAAKSKIDKVNGLYRN